MSRLSMGAMLRRSLIHRRARSLSALVAMTVSAAVATALLTLYADLNAKLHHEFRSFGANIVVTAADQQKGIPSDALRRAKDAAGESAIASEFGYAVVAGSCRCRCGARRSASSELHHRPPRDTVDLRRQTIDATLCGHAPHGWG